MFFGAETNPCWRVRTSAPTAPPSQQNGPQVYDAFRFIDTDNSGELSKDELRDGFFALGVYLSDEVSEQIMTVSHK